MAVATQNPSTRIVEYSVSDEAIALLRERLEGKAAETPAGYKEVREGIAEVRGLRVKVEKTRKELNADAVAYKKKVDTEAKRITSLLVDIEEPLKITKQEVDDLKQLIKREAEEPDQRRIDEVRRKAQEEENEIQRAKAAKIKVDQEAEQKRIDAEKAELAKGQAKLKAAQEAEDIDSIMGPVHDPSIPAVVDQWLLDKLEPRYGVVDTQPTDPTDPPTTDPPGVPGMTFADIIAILIPIILECVNNGAQDQDVEAALRSPNYRQLRRLRRGINRKVKREEPGLQRRERRGRVDGLLDSVIVRGREATSTEIRQVIDEVKNPV